MRLHHAPVGPVAGIVGVSGLRNSFEKFGEETLVPNNAYNKWFLSGFVAKYKEQPNYASYQMAQAFLGVKLAWEKAQDGKALIHLEAMLSSMTATERAKPGLINAKRKIRVAKGSGTTVQEVNKLLKMHQEMASVMKRLKKMGGFGKLAALFGKGGMEGAMGGLLPGAGAPGLPGLPGGSSPFGLPPGGNKFGKK